MEFDKLAKQPADLSVAEMSSRRLAEEAVTSELLSRPERYVSNFTVGGSFGERQRETLQASRPKPDSLIRIPVAIEKLRNRGRSDK
jgi:hypothetical protein